MACNITGTVVIPDGSSAANRMITLRKQDFTLSAQGTLTILPEEIVVYTDALGNVDFDLVAGTYSGYYVNHPEGRTPFRLKVPSDTATANFADLIVTTSIAEDPALTQAVLEAYQGMNSRSNSIFGIGDNPDGQSYDVVIASPAIVGETGGDLPTVTVEIETGVVKSLLTYEAGLALAGSGFKEVDTFTDLSSSFGYTAGSGRIAVADGDYVKVTDIGATYRVASASASNAHLDFTASSGVKLYVVAGNGPVNVKAFGAKGDGVADDYPSISAALTNFGRVYVPGGRYKVSQTVEVYNKVLIGENAFDGSNTKMTTIIGMASIPIYDPVIAPARSGSVQCLRIQYDTGVITGSETEGQRRGIGPKAGLPAMQRGSNVSYIWLTDVGTGIGTVTGSDGSTNGIFSASFNDIEIVRHSYAAIDLKGAGTGNVFGSVYIADATDHLGPLRPLYGVRLRDSNNDFWAQLNIEHMSYSEAALDINDARNISFATLHLEGIDTRGADQRFVRISGSQVSITNCSVIHTGMSFDNTAVFELGDARCFQLRQGTGTPWSYTSKVSSLGIENLQLRGLTNPNSSYYDNARRGLENVQGFKLLRRTDGFLDKNFRVKIENVMSAAYTSTSEWLVYRLIDTEQYSDTGFLDIEQFSKRGSLVNPCENFVKNGAFDSFDNTNAVATTSTPVACATDWSIESGSGSLSATKQVEGYGSDAKTFIRLSNVGTVGTNQRLQTNIPDWRDYVGRELVLSFEGRANITGQVFSQISCSSIWTGGNPSGGVYRQLIGGTSQALRFSNEWKTFRIPFTGLPPESFTSEGSSPYWRLRFEINGGSALIGAQIDLRNVKVEAGVEPSSFSRRTRP